jgi:mannose-1-phosphate guanylyltransferase/mannose-6-phosphate isomerase
MKIIPVILSGGSGTNLWPLSRKHYPKQFLPLIEEQTMLQVSLQRLEGLDNLADPIIICNVEHRFLAAEQLQQIGIKNPTILLEPVGRSTAPAIAVAAHYIESIRRGTEGEKNLLLILSADHLIKDVSKFHQAIKIASEQALNGKLVTFGVVPTYPYTGYGYIKTTGIEHDSAIKIENFKEKPSQAKAQQYLKQGNYLWNSGMFLFQSDQLLKELAIHSVGIVENTLESFNNATKDLDFIRLESEAFTANINESIDFALMEKTDQAVVVPIDIGWADIGSWNSLYEISNKDQYNNVSRGDVISVKTSNSYIQADHHLVVTIGIDNLIIVDTMDAILISTKDKKNQIKQVVEKLQIKDRNEVQVHRKVYRPWGWYDSIDKSERFQVKRICVNPGASISLQKHFYRAEHWIVVSGIAKVTNGNRVEMLSESQSASIQVGAIHRLENPGDTPLEIIEIQTGSYLGEDDIERFDDQYNRALDQPVKKHN